MSDILLSDKFKDLKEPFPKEDVEWRIQSSGDTNDKVWAICLVYITNRAIMERLDTVIGPENWKNEYTTGPHGGVLCGLSIRVNDEWITKWDGAENTNVEAIKGGLSGAMKRAAVQWGIGRYLYNVSETFANISENGIYRAKTKSGKSFKWTPPQLPPFALPSDKQPEIPDDIPETIKQDEKFYTVMYQEKDRIGAKAFAKIIKDEGYEKMEEIKEHGEQKRVYQLMRKQKGVKDGKKET